MSRGNARVIASASSSSSPSPPSSSSSRGSSWRMTSFSTPDPARALPPASDGSGRASDAARARDRAGPMSDAAARARVPAGVAARRRPLQRGEERPREDLAREVAGAVARAPRLRPREEALLEAEGPEGRRRVVVRGQRQVRLVAGAGAGHAEADLLADGAEGGDGGAERTDVLRADFKSEEGRRGHLGLTGGGRCDGCNAWRAGLSAENGPAHHELAARQDEALEVLIEGLERHGLPS